MGLFVNKILVSWVLGTVLAAAGHASALPEATVETGNPFALVRIGQSDEHPVLRLRNPGRDPVRTNGRVVFKDFLGRSFPVSIPAEMKPGEERMVPLAEPLPAKGAWIGRVAFEVPGVTNVERILRFAAIDLHRPTPFMPKPKFRFGMNINFSQRQLEAVVAAGFKIVRATAGTSMIEAEGAGDGKYDWSEADDAIGRLQSAGIALDAIIYSNPWWALDPAYVAERGKVGGVPWLAPTREGLFRDHCRRLAERYGTKIDYYEVGNEFDLRDPRLRTHAEAIRMQREAYEGIHSVLADACVTTCGFAGAAPRREFAFSSEVLENYAAHPEIFDAWAFHCHGAFHDYERVLESHFLPFRRNSALNAKPWIPNETATSCYRREEADVARNAWAKPLYAWSRGAADYVWYNLVAIGPGDDNETGYGVMTHDMKPRAAYAAFAALTRIFQGLDFDGAIYSRRLRHLLRFRGKSEGADGIVVAGWDWKAKERRTIRLRTDARTAAVSDLMGNPTSLQVKDGIVDFAIDANPQALILDGATKAEAVDLHELEDKPVEAIVIPEPAAGRAPDFVLDKVANVRELHPSAAMTAHRVWSGPKDQSAKIWLGHDGSALLVRVVVEDDIDAKGDGVVLSVKLPGRPVVELGPSERAGFTVRRSRAGTITEYELRVEGGVYGFDERDLFSGFGFSLRVLEDDGEGADGWLQLVTEIEDAKFLRFAPPACGITRLKYNNPDAKPYLKVGLWAWPAAVDYDGDGRLDLVVSCSDVPYGGTHVFVNPGGGVLPVFKKGRRVAKGMDNFARMTSVGDGRSDLCTPGRRFDDFPVNGYTKPQEFTGVNQNVHPCTVRGNIWREVDFDGDGYKDILIGVDDWHLVSRALWWGGEVENFTKDGMWIGPRPEGLVYLVRNLGAAGSVPAYGVAERLKLADGSILRTEGNPMPMCADWDGDGDLDLICGEFVDGFTYFENVGTRSSPRFAPGRRVVTSYGSRLAMELAMITPSAVDWDGDGRLDIICGDEDGRVAFIRNTGTRLNGVPVFEPPQYFRQEADAVNFGCLSTPCAVDWDGDGDYDIITGSSAGHIGFIENLSGAGVAEPKWAEPVRLKAGGDEIRVMAGEKGSVQGPFERKWGYTCLSVADWDGDGLPDVMVNSIWGDVVWFRNVGTRTRPELAPAADVVVDWEGTQPELAFGWYRPCHKRNPRALLTQWRTTPVMIDLDRDGLMDLVMLDTEGYLAFYRRTRNGDGSLALQPPKRIFADAEGKLLRLNSKTRGHSGRVKFTLADVNGDGAPDLVVNSRNAAVRLNLGEKNGVIRFGGPKDVSDRRLSNHTTSPSTVDFDGDGVTDFLIGAEDGYFYHCRNRQWAR